jgi:ribosomal protein S18 acetylase RimI-like enzyme
LPADALGLLAHWPAGPAGSVVAGPVRQTDAVPTLPGPSIRRYRADDHDAVYEVCVRTGAGGADARGLYPNDDLLPDIYAGPYLHLEPDLAFVLDDGGRAVGYVIGTADTARFVTRYRREWLPLMAQSYQEPAGSPTTSFEAHVAGLFHPERMLVNELFSYPAHLHIDILPAYQRAGHGRRLIAAFLDEVARAGAPAVCLGVARANTGAQAFYRRVGFELLEVGDRDGSALYFGRTTSPEGLPPE